MGRATQPAEPQDEAPLQPAFPFNRPGEFVIARCTTSVEGKFGNRLP